MQRNCGLHVIDELGTYGPWQSCLVQDVSSGAHRHTPACCKEDLSAFFRHGKIEGKDYSVVAILGCQSTGKSAFHWLVFLNKCFTFCQLRAKNVAHRMHQVCEFWDCGWCAQALCSTMYLVRTSIWWIWRKGDSKRPRGYGLIVPTRSPA